MADQLEFKVSLKRIAKHNFLNTISSDSLQELIFETLNPPDFIYSLAFSYDVSLPDESESGLAVDYTANNAWIAGLALGFVTALAIANFYHEYKKQKKEKNNSSHGYIYDQLEKDDHDLARQIEEEVGNYLGEMSEEQRRQAKKRVILEPLKELLKEDGELNGRYESIDINENDELILKAKKNQVAPTLQLKPIEISKPLVRVHWYERWYDRLGQEAAEIFRLYTEAVKPAIEKFKKSPFNKKFLSPIYQALCITAAAYWVLWAGAALITGVFGVGIAGVPDIVTFGIPSLLGGLFLGMKIRNYYNHKRKKNAIERDALYYADLSEKDEYLERREQAEQDTLRLLRRFKMDRIFKLKRNFLLAKLQIVERESEKVEEELRLSAEMDARVQGSEALNKQITYLEEDLGVKSVTTFISDTASTFVWLQYIAWLTMDFFKKIYNVALGTPGVNLIVGSIVMIASVLHGAYKAFTTYFERSEQAQKVRQLKEQVQETGQLKESLETLYTQKRQEFNREQEREKAKEGGKPLALSFDPLKFEEDQFFNDINRRGPTNQTKLRKIVGRVWTWVTSFTTGVFLAKLFLVAGNAPLLPFAVAALSNPVTTAIVTVCGFLWASFTLYEYIKKRQEARALQTLHQYTERIYCLKQQIKLLDLGIRVLKKQGRQELVTEVVPEATLNQNISMRKRGHTVSSESRVATLFALKRPVRELVEPSSSFSCRAVG